MIYIHGVQVLNHRFTVITVLRSGYPLVRGAIRDGLINLIKEHFPEVEVISGTATAGIPHAAFIAEKLKLPMNYVRSSNKSHGKQNQIEGAKSEGKKVVVIEDLISTGDLQSQQLKP